MCCSNVRSSCFISLCENGSWNVWDVRCNNKTKPASQLQTKKNNTTASKIYEEVLFAEDQHSILTIAEGGLIELYDTRKVGTSHSTLRQKEADDTVRVYQHPADVMQFVAGPHPKGESITLFVDEIGAVVPLHISSLMPTEVLPRSTFHSTAKIDNEVLQKEGRTYPSFGELSNICCGLSRTTASNLTARSSKEEIPVPLLIAQGMDGCGVLYRSPSSFNPFDLPISFDDGRKLVANPPLPTCLSVLRDRVAIGRADGSYTITEIQGGESVVELLTAPGHPTSGLCGVEWLGSGDQNNVLSTAQRSMEGLEPLLTVSLTGDVTVWRVQEFLLDTEGTSDNEDEVVEYADFPAVCSAYSIRDVVNSTLSVTNCLTTLGDEDIMFGDNLGNIVSCHVEML